MAETKIEWADYTFNPWIGCQKVSAACDHCYAETWDARFKGDRWGPRAARTKTSDANWRKPLAWNRAAAAEGVRRKVFCASLADVFDNHSSIAQEWRADLWQLIRDTPNLDWLLLTKRPQNIAKMLPRDWGDGYPNVWIGTTVENQEEADRRIPHLLKVPTAVRFLSCEPLLGPVEIRGHRESCGDCDPCLWGRPDQCAVGSYFTGALHPEGIHWVICGGESGPKARPTHPDWIRSLRDQCIAADVPFFFKQWGEWMPQIGAIDYLDDDPEKSRFRWAEWTDFGGGPEHWDFIDQPQWCDEMDPDHSVIRVGKKASGRHIDGVTWDQFPALTIGG